MAENTLPVPQGLPAPANPLGRLGGMSGVRALLDQPAVKKSIPGVTALGLLGAAALAWTTLSTPPQRMLYQGLGDSDKAAISEALTTAKIDNAIDSAGTLTVAEDDYYKARMLLAAQNLPKSDPGGYAILDQLPLGVSRAVEGERLRQARETEIAKSVKAIDAVQEARVHLAMPESSVFVRDNAAPSASVMVRLAAGRSLSQEQVRSIINLVASSVPGMKPDAVTIVDQAGELLTNGDKAGDNTAASQRIDFQTKVEAKYRDQLAKLLTPLVGDGNFTAEVQAEVNLDESQATRESWDKDNAALRAENGSWATGPGADGQNTGGIPGAMSNSPPPPTTVTSPPPPGTVAAPGAPANATQAAAGPPPPATKQTDQFQRTFELGKEISVTRAMPGQVKRLSVAVVLRDPAAKKRSAAEIKQINDLVRAAVGYDQGRNDQVTVVSSAFAGATEPTEAAWYDAGWFPTVARNLTALVIALLVILFGVKPLVAALIKGRKEQLAQQPNLLGASLGGAGSGPALAGEPGGAPGRAPVSIDDLESARSYDQRVALVKDFTRDNPARAALAVRDMIRADVKQGA
jgi:flagellar M-ring protein FliF